jgi:hypothetical protein
VFAVQISYTAAARRHANAMQQHLAGPSQGGVSALANWRPRLGSARLLVWVGSGCECVVGGRGEKRSGGTRGRGTGKQQKALGLVGIMAWQQSLGPKVFIKFI